MKPMIGPVTGACLDVTLHGKVFIHYYYYRRDLRTMLLRPAHLCVSNIFQYKFCFSSDIV